MDREQQANGQAERDGEDCSVIWEPQVKQAEFISCPADDVGFGGARGGGKSDAVIGDWASHEDLYGPDAIGLAFRRERTQLVELIERARQVLVPIGHKWHEQDKYFRGPKGGRLRFSYLERDADADAYQGHSYCVAVGTRIRMADGSLKAIERIEVGEAVATLEGPRRVSAVTRPYVAPCVKAVVRDSAGHVVGGQVHPVWHPVLTSGGLISLPSPHGRRSDEQLQSERFSADRQDQGLSACADRVRRGWLSWSEDVRSARIVWPLRLGGAGRLRSLTVPVVLHEPSVRSAIEIRRADRMESTVCHALGRWRSPWSGLHRGYQSLLSGLRQLAGRARSIRGLWSPSLANGRADAPSGWSGVQDSPVDCRPDHDSCGGRVLEKSGIGLASPPSRGGAENRRPVSPSDGLDTTQPHSRWVSERWVHPYTGEARCLSAAVTSGTMEVRYCGEAWVADLTVEDANHYISECGLVNKNTRLYPEEMGTFPAEGPINKLGATLRSGNGVPCQMKGTCNPGGPGHGWVKARYRLDRFPHGYEPFTFEFTNPFTGKKVSKTRVFIPSRVTDNQYLGDDYVASLQMSGSESLVRAWLLGDWDVIEGAFFDCWRADRHVVEPFDIPEHWIKARSFDWGFAKPFSVGWWAVASEPTKLSNGLWLPRGGLVRFAEWYGAASPDVGMKLQASQIAEGIKYLEAGLGIEKVDLSIADTAIFAEAGASLGYKGPSIAEAMARAGVQFRPADKRRLLGWDQFRGRLIGDADKNPMVVVTTRCQDFIRTVPVLQHDKVKPEDLDTDGEDHCFTGDTLVSTSNGVYSIADLVGTTGLVWSGDGRLHGYRSPRRTRADAPVVKLTFSDGTIIRCTPDHRFLTTRGWVEAKSLSSLSLRPFRSFSGSATTGAGDTFSARASGFIARCGNTIAGLSRRATTFITGTMTEAGIRLATCSASPKAHTPGYTGWRGQTSRETSSSVPALLQQHGTAATPAGSGIASNIGFTVPRLCSRMWRAIAATAGDGSSGRSRANIVPTTASPLFDGPVASIMKAASAASAAWASWSADTQRSKRVPASAERYPAQGRERVCLSVEPDGRADVYCLTVPDTGNFVLASGVIVANCADEARYMMMARPWTAKSPEKREEMQGMEALTLDRLFDERESERRWQR